MRRKTKILFLYFGLMAAWFVFNSRSGNPPNGRTNAPFDGFCTDCHSPNTDLDGTVSISGVPDIVMPGETYNATIAVNVTQGSAVRAGFQLVSVFSADNTNAGDLIAKSNGEGTENSGGREYIEQRGAKNFSNNAATWSFDWIAPEGDDGAQITMYYAGNITNGNGSSSGDRPNSGSTTFTLKAASDPLTVSISDQTNVSCNGGNNGSATAAGAGGTPPYAFTWSNGVNSATANNLSAGIYTVSVTDNEMNSVAEMVTISEPSVLTLSGSTTDVLCNGENSGSINLTSGGGTPPYDYVWSNGLSTPNLGSLGAGSYTVTLTDNNGCATSQTYMVLEPDPILITLNSSDETAFMANDGTASVQASGGGVNFSYNWSDGSATQNVDNLAPGMYSVTVSDGAGCSEIGLVTIQAYICSLEAGVNTTPVSCFGDSTGTASVNVTGATAPVTYQWSNGTSDEMVSGLPAGMYSVTVADGGGCQSILAYEITQPDNLSAMVGITSTTCPGDSSGSITVNMSGGVAPYTFNWATGSMVNSLINLIAGNYALTVTDGNGCTLDLNFQVNQIDEVHPVAIGQDIAVYVDSIGTASLSPEMVDNGSNDNCGIDSMWLSVSSLSCPDNDSTTVVLMVRDEAGLIGSDTIKVVLRDTIAPVFTNCPKDIEVDSGQTVTYELPEAFDNCIIDSLVMTEGLPSGSVFPAGETKVSYMATDRWENITCCSFFVTVDMTTGSDDLSIEGIVVSPNPFRDQIILDMISVHDNIEVKLFSFTGRLLYDGVWKSGDKHIIQTGQLVEGVYLLKVQQGEAFSTRKLVKY